MDKDQNNTNPKKEQEKKLSGYPEYPKSEDIFNKEEEEEYDLEDEDEPMEMGLDVPGSELDDENEIIGEEDEENNYYSIGGDNHEDLEEKS